LGVMDLWNQFRETIHWWEVSRFLSTVGTAVWTTVSGRLIDLECFQNALIMEDMTTFECLTELSE